MTSHPSSRRRRILVVEDDPLVASLLSDFLTAEGHAVDTALNGRLALERLRAEPYDLIVSDMRMPELDGEGFFAAFDAVRPGMRSRIIFVTGQALTPETREFIARAQVPILGKPFNLDALREMTEEMFAAQPSR
ncbi:MAG TPA: response regulator [Methylomirabilota bacterium]|nr:response regulator [Methylomirabilota bacterium]